eukprot:6440359-Ditylum_brightwellii.AAC.1
MNPRAASTPTMMPNYQVIFHFCSPYERWHPVHTMTKLFCRPGSFLNASSDPFPQLVDQPGFESGKLAHQSSVAVHLHG